MAEDQIGVLSMSCSAGVPPAGGAGRYLGFTAEGEPWLMRWSAAHRWMMVGIPGALSGLPVPTECRWAPEEPPVPAGVPVIVAWIELPVSV